MTANLTAEAFASTAFDYIIIGGGTAGLVLAARLSEDPKVQVGVIEAGEWDPNVPEINIPGLGGMLIGNPKWDWGFASVPQRHVNGRQMPQTRGKGLGGSSLMNLTNIDRASAHEYDAIEALGNPGWNWNQFLKYFKKSETTHAIDPDHAAKYSLVQPDPRWHGDSGPVAKSYPLHFVCGRLQEYLVRTHENLGVPLNPDSNDGNKVGLSRLFTTVDSTTATRSYATTAYFAPNAHRKNLFVITGSTVSKIIFQPGSSPLLATGVEFLKGDKTYHASSKKEVIVSGGSYQSPQILELSGIGNRDILSKYGIETFVDLPAVGENFQDHIYVPIIYEIDPQFDTLDAAREPGAPARMQELYMTKQGPLTSSPAFTFSFVPARTFLTDEQQEKWTSGARAVMEKAAPGLKKQYATQLKYFHDPSSAEGELMPFPGFLPWAGVESKPNARYVSICSAFLHPLSRGSVHIASADPTAPPAIDPDYFSKQEDLDVLLAIVKFTIKFFETSPFSDIVRSQVAPSPDITASDEALLEYIKNTCICVFHPVGTVSMLPKEDGGVVDPELRVYGTANVRVVDASIIPLQIAAHSQATVYALAEKAADIIRGL
ncbi:GMC oxidoreductase [Daedaleopsis nitida]|nr:GMC oxidoreductase [Daedaleopsis nitida]